MTRLSPDDTPTPLDEPVPEELDGLVETPPPVAVPEPEPEPVPAAPAFDALQWQSTLFGLLAHLDYLRTEMARFRLMPDATLLLDITDAMVRACDELTRETEVRAECATTQMEALGKAGAYYSSTAKLRPLLNKGVLGSFWSALVGNTDIPTEAVVRDALLMGVQAIHQYFVLFTEQFGDSASAAGWVDAASAFGSDLKQLVRELPAN